MSDVIFCRPRHEYDSYADLWQLVELSDYPIQFIDEIDAESDNTYIFATPATHWHDGTERHGWPDAKARIIFYSMEWYQDVNYAEIPGVELWSPDLWYSQKVGARFVPLGSHPGLMIGAPANEVEYDVAFLAYMIGRREAVRAHLEACEVKVSPRGGWGMARHKILTHSRVMIHVHQWPDVPTLAPLRVAVAAAYSLPLLMEIPAELAPLTLAHVLPYDFGSLADATVMWLQRKDPAILADYGRALHGHLCVDNTFRSYIEAAL